MREGGEGEGERGGEGEGEEGGGALTSSCFPPVLYRQFYHHTTLFHAPSTHPPTHPRLALTQPLTHGLHYSIYRCLFILFQGAAYAGFIDIHWNAIEHKMEESLDLDGDGKVRDG